MADLIDRAALKVDAWGRLSDAVRDLDKAPAVDAVPVVRCKDCKHSHHYSWGSYSCSFHEYEGEPHVEPSGFCNYGERREGK